MKPLLTLTSGLLIYTFSLFLFKPQNWQDIALPLVATGNLSLPAAWFYYYRDAAILHFNGNWHPQVPLFSLLWSLYPPLAPFLLQLANVFLLSYLYLYQKSPLAFWLASFAGYQNGIPLFASLLFSTLAFPSKAASVKFTLLSYFLLTWLSPASAFWAIWFLTIKSLQKRYLSITLAALSGMLLAAAGLIFLLEVKGQTLLAFLTCYWIRFFAKMQPMWLLVKQLPTEVWLITSLNCLLVGWLLFSRKKILLKKTKAIPLLLELLLLLTIPWFFSLGHSWFLLLLLPAKLVRERRLAGKRSLTIVCWFCVSLLLLIMSQKKEPPLLSTSLPAAIAVGIDDLKGRDDLLLIRYSQVKIYLLDLKVIPENYSLAQLGSTTATGNKSYLFSKEAREFFLAEQNYAQAIESAFAKESDRGILVSGENPIKESKPFSRARQILAKYPTTRLLWVSDW